MSRSSRFVIKNHVVPAASPRAWPRCTAHPSDVLRLALNQYTPVENTTPRKGDATIIMNHANGFHKELYEPFLEVLVDRLREAGVGVRGIWAADVVSQGESGVINEGKLGDEFCWTDHARDILHLIQTHELTPAHTSGPLLGLGHSMGGNQIFHSAIMHPRLFTAIVGIDPIIEPGLTAGHAPAKASIRRRDIWSSMDEARAYFKSKPFYQSWDPRVLELHMQFGLRELPTPTYPDKKGVTLTTTKDQEVWSFLRHAPPNPPGRPEAVDVFKKLGGLGDLPVMYLLGEKSHINTEKGVKAKRDATPGAEFAWIKDAGHLVPQEKPVETAEVIAEFLTKAVAEWRKEWDTDMNQKRSKVMSEQYKEAVAKL
ncbi:alpha/beta-hydrolase [Saitoella complicata NRRL Y-17804]|uniref:AB hydrolase-1 domain-containing protein n=1 Tax=Saitoella complicata (strain BCRC 22490 / CBS 7301 / JCM 7358 / NBRC 10748 / NRRL Y-17804) TaxID=698492 RepID=A0A0E9NHX3_SAICN|nr:alpha/beta-hydrolase [Saitoella complicata NRRL Y-17804]ODQ56094.1 alpha/beta-hydrolase [Saitoella complicata NRRL Y-17804]GAO49439.1 hypothetical protein G7K_3589-t1 [Saitoella complicata NRRL Y-17804]